MGKAIHLGSAHTATTTNTTRTIGKLCCTIVVEIGVSAAAAAGGIRVIIYLWLFLLLLLLNANRTIDALVHCKRNLH